MSNTEPSGYEEWKAHMAARKKEEEAKEARRKAKQEKEKEMEQAATQEDTLTAAPTKSKSKNQAKTEPETTPKAASSKGMEGEIVDPSRIGEPGPIGKKRSNWVKDLRAKNEERLEDASLEFMKDLSDDEGQGKREKKEGRALEDETTNDEEGEL
ncbi:hypothetical protein BDV96DRAFT_641099 [Lophiotrema nucula]|uniref:Uncharacterized protein n=1 Tax=Lophiotrema nucula TaxID=690887 RepID=A0A6A5ZQA7_9PLEO|nr:hypothetical protein BDV96DRAFT_641099 [Lophiotrema nucula]